MTIYDQAFVKVLAAFAKVLAAIDLALDRLGPWPGIVLGAFGAGLMAWTIIDLAKGL